MAAMSLYDHVLAVVFGFVHEQTGVDLRSADTAGRVADVTRMAVQSIEQSLADVLNPIQPCSIDAAMFDEALAKALAARQAKHDPGSSTSTRTTRGIHTQPQSSAEPELGDAQSAELFSSHSPAAIITGSGWSLVSSPVSISSTDLNGALPHPGTRAPYTFNHSQGR
jgi:hypothetical protein